MASMTYTQQVLDWKIYFEHKQIVQEHKTFIEKDDTIRSRIRAIGFVMYLSPVCDCGIFLSIQLYYF